MQECYWFIIPVLLLEFCAGRLLWLELVSVADGESGDQPLWRFLGGPELAKLPENIPTITIMAYTYSDHNSEITTEQNPTGMAVFYSNQNHIGIFQRPLHTHIGIIYFTNLTILLKVVHRLQNVSSYICLFLSVSYEE